MAAAFTKINPLCIHILRHLTDEEINAFKSRLAENVKMTCLSETVVTQAMSGSCDVIDLLPKNEDGDLPVHILVEGDVRNTYMEDLLLEAKKREMKSFLIPFAGVSAGLKAVLSGKEICVFNSHHNAPMTSEMCVSLLLAAAKQTVAADGDLRKGSWRRRGIPVEGGPTHPQVLEQIILQGKKIVIIGIRGNIGKRVGRMCAAGIDMEVVGTSASCKEVHDFDLGGSTARVYPAGSLIDLLRGASAVVVACPATDASQNIIGHNELAAMSDDGNKCILVNIGRGSCVDGDAVHEALASRKLFAFASDVWYKYPSTWEEANDCMPKTDSGLSFAEGLPGERSTLSAHRGGAVGQSEAEMRRWDAIANACNYAAKVGDATKLSAEPNGLIGSVNLERGY